MPFGAGTTSESIRVGDEVLTLDTELEEVVVGTVERTFAHRDYANGALILGDGGIVHSTPDHPFFRERVMSVKTMTCPEENEEMRVAFAEELMPSDRVYVLEGDFLRLAAVATASFYARPATVYNFTLTGTHSYFAEGILLLMR